LGGWPVGDCWNGEKGLGWVSAQDVDVDVGDAGGDEEDVKPKAKKVKAEKFKVEAQPATPLPRLASELARR